MEDDSALVPDPSKILGPIEEAILPLPPEDAKARMGALSAIVMFEKVLTQSDTSGSGRLVIPKVGYFICFSVRSVVDLMNDTLLRRRIACCVQAPLLDQG